jgi:hypothetical protein
MATVIREICIDAPADAVWDALRDFGRLHDRLVRGFVVATEFDGEERVVTFFNGATARERLVTVDDDARRLVYTIVESGLGLAHDNSVAQVFTDGDAGTTRFVWTKDVLPDAVAPALGELMERGLAAIKATMESREQP